MAHGEHFSGTLTACSRCDSAARKVSTQVNWKRNLGHVGSKAKSYHLSTSSPVLCCDVPRNALRSDAKCSGLEVRLTDTSGNQLKISRSRYKILGCCSS